MSRSRLVTTELDGPRDPARWRRIRSRIVAAQRRDRPHPCVPASMLAIDVVERGPRVRYPASALDVRAVLDRLPPGILDGLGHIRLLPPIDTDEIAPEVHESDPRALYRYGDASIELFGYAYDPDTVRERSILETHLRAQMLYALLHEVGHHHDYARRGRWREHDWDNEVQADAYAGAWMRAHALPYLEEAYPDELAELQRWFLRHTGVPLTIDVLLGARDGHRYIFGAADGFAGLVSAVMRDEPIDADQLCTFAYHVHIDYHIDEALRIVEHVLAGDPDNEDALKWRRHFLSHLDE